MKLVSFSIARPVTITMLMVAAIVFGIVAFERLPINLLPDISYPTITVRTEYPGTAPGEIEHLITRRIEERVGVVPGVVRTTSTSRPGLSDVVVEFNWGTEMSFASLDVHEKLDVVNLPQDANTPILLRFDPSLDPIMRIALAGDDDLISLRLMAEERIKQEIESINGVASVQVSGGMEEEIQINIHEGKLSQLGISVTQISNRLSQENINLTGGSLKDGEAEFLVRTLNEFKNIDDINDIVIGMRGNAPVMLKDVAIIVKGHKERKVITHLNGKESVEIAIYKEANLNTVIVAKLVLERLNAIMAEYEKYDVPIDMTIVNDQSKFIENSVDEVLNTAMLGGLFAILVLYLFLRSAKSTVIISLAIPISVMVTFFCMFITDVSLNIMSLGGLALGVGMLVDNAIVVLESIDRYRQDGVSAVEAAIKGASEVGHAVVASTLTTVCVFVPIIFVEGIAGQLFNDQALTVTFSLVASLAVALTLIPMLSSLTVNMNKINRVERENQGMIRRTADMIFIQGPAMLLHFFGKIFGFFIAVFQKLFGRLFDTFDRGIENLSAAYPRLLDRVFARSKLFLFVTVSIFAFAVISFRFIGSELIPSMSQGEFFVDVTLPIGTPVEKSNVVIKQMSNVTSQAEGIESVYVMAGTSAQMGFSNTEERENIGQLHIKLKPGYEGDAEQGVMDDLRDALAGFPGVEYKFSRPTLFSFKTPVEVEIRGYNLQELDRLGQELVEKMRTIEGLRDVKSSTEGGNPEVQIIFDRKKVAQVGLDVATIGNIVRNKVQGDVSTELNRQDRKIDIRVRNREKDRNSIDDLRRLIINPSGPVPISLSSVAELKLERGPSEIRRVDQERVAVVTANLTDRDLGSVSVEIQQKVDELILPPDFRISMGGQRREMATSFDSMKLAIGLAIFLVYLVMASQFESLVQPFIIMFTIPFAIIGVALSLFITGTPISVVVLIGAIMLAGIVVNNAIILIDYINGLRKDGLDKRSAIKRAGQVRLRPILMTTLTTVLGLLPMALGLGEGAELRTPMAVTVIGGLLIGTLLTLVVIPTVYDAIVREKKKTVGAEEAAVSVS